MDKNIIKETMLSLEGAALQTRSVRMEEISTRALALTSCAGSLASESFRRGRRSRMKTITIRHF